MRIKTLMTTLALALFFLAAPEAARAQKDGEPQAVIFGLNNRPTLKFSDKGEKRDHCGLFVSYTVMENQEEAFAVAVDHMHRRVQIWGGTSFPERGWLYITPSRVVFTVAGGDRSHAFDAPRAELKDKPGTRFRIGWAGLQINFKERLAASNSREQKFVFLTPRDRKCFLSDPSRFNKFMERAVNDFDDTMAEFKQVTDSLKQAGKVQQLPLIIVPPAGAGAVTDATGGSAPPPAQADPPGIERL